MPKIKFLHTADIHIGYTTHGRQNPATGKNTRVEDFERCLRTISDTAVREDVDLVIIAGDLYRDPYPSQSDQKAFAAAIEPILTKRIPTVIITGNHDNPVSFGKTAATEIFGVLAGDFVTVISQPRRVCLRTKSGPVTVIGMPWPTATMLRAQPEFKGASREELNAVVLQQCESWLDDAIQACDDEVPTIIAAHLEVRGAFLTEGSERSAIMTKDPVFPVSMLARHEVDYVALGHIHKHQDMNDGHQPPVVYSGSPERISFNEEDQTKGFVIGEVSRGSCKWRQVETPARQMRTITIFLPEGELACLPMLLILSGIANAHGPKKELAGAIVRVRITCTAAQKSAIAVPDIRKALLDCDVSTIAGIEIEATDTIVRSRAPELHVEAGPLAALETYLRAVGTSDADVLRLTDAAAEL